MKIDSAAVGMESARTYRSVKTENRRFAGIIYQESLSGEDALYAGLGKQSQGQLKSNTDTEGKQEEQGTGTDTAVYEWQNRFGVSASRLNIRSTSENVISDIRQMTLRYIFNLLFSGRRRGSYDGENMESINSGIMEKNHPAGWMNGAVNGSQIYSQSVSIVKPMQFKAFAITADYHEVEQEETSFSTVGTVRTSDGREINFNVNVGMSREFERYYSNEVQLAPNLCDPLVINLDTDAASLEDQTFYFDIDADGELDEISGLGAGSGYLALDKNSDGKINDGSELFGTKSGNGFADLAAYDDDHNGWIDENDAIWSKLKIWTKDSKGNDVLCNLAEKNVGAVYLGNVSTDHTLKGADGQTKGAIRNTGILVYENGNVGSIQHVDVAKYARLA